MLRRLHRKNDRPCVHARYVLMRLPKVETLEEVEELVVCLLISIRNSGYHARNTTTVTPQKRPSVCACAVCLDALAEGGNPGRGGRARYFGWNKSHRRQQQRQRAFLAQPSCTSGADREHRFNVWIRATRQAESHRPGWQ